MAPRVVRALWCAALIGSLAQPALANPRHGPGKGFQSEGCIAVGTHSVAYSGLRPWDCRYTATGPSLYMAATSNPFTISIWNEATEAWHDVVRRGTAGGPVSGRVATKAGDKVAVSIACWDYTRGTWCRDAIGGRYGVVAIHSEI